MPSSMDFLKPSDGLEPSTPSLPWREFLDMRVSASSHRPYPLIRSASTQHQAGRAAVNEVTTRACELGPTSRTIRIGAVRPDSFIASIKAQRGPQGLG